MAVTRDDQGISSHVTEEESEISGPESIQPTSNGDLTALMSETESHNLKVAVVTGASSGTFTTVDECDADIRYLLKLQALGRRPP